MSAETVVEFLSKSVEGNLEVAESTIYTHDEMEDFFMSFIEDYEETVKLFGLGTSDCLVHVVAHEESDEYYFFVFERVSDGKFLGRAKQDQDSGEVTDLVLEADNN